MKRQDAEARKEKDADKDWRAIGWLDQMDSLLAVAPKRRDCNVRIVDIPSEGASERPLSSVTVTKKPTGGTPNWRLPDTPPQFAIEASELENY